MLGFSLALSLESETFMRAATVCSFLPITACAIGLAFSGLPGCGAMEDKKPILELQLVSPKRGVDARGPRFVLAGDKLYLFWMAVEDSGSDISIAGIDAERKRVGPPQKVALPAEVDFKSTVPGETFRIPPIVLRFAAMPAVATPRAEGPTTPFLLAYSASPTPYSNTSVYRFARVLPNRKEGGYRAEPLGRFLPDDADSDTSRGVITPEQISFVRRDGEKRSLFLVGSNYPQLWSIGSGDGGKTWSVPQIIVKGSQSFEPYRYAAVAESPAGELLLFSNAQTRSSGGYYTEIHLRRSKDGKTWSEPKEILDGRWLTQTCPFVDGKAIWLAYADKKPKGNSSTIFLSRSTDEGKTWEVPLPLTDGEHDDSEPTIAVRGDTLYLAVTRAVPRRPGAREGDVKHQVWFGHVAVKDIQFPRAK
jgi:hypothetical protein